MVMESALALWSLWFHKPNPDGWRAAGLVVEFKEHDPKIAVRVEWFGKVIYEEKIKESV